MTTLSMPVEESVAEAAAAVFARLGLDTQTAVRIFLRRAVAERGIPFELRDDPFHSEPNMAFLRQGAEDFKNGVNFHEHELVDPPAFESRLAHQQATLCAARL